MGIREDVLDASVLLAALLQERSEVDLPTLIDGAIMSAVNLSEVWAKASEFGLIDAPRLGSLVSLLGRIEPFTAAQARLAAGLRLKTKHLGLSLGDRACLALAIDKGQTAYTAETKWASMEMGCKVSLIRRAETRIT